VLDLGRYEGLVLGRTKITEMGLCGMAVVSSIMKYGLLGRDFALPIATWFDGSVHRLAIRLHQFFKSRFGAIGKPLSALNPANDYDEYLGHIQQAITELENEPERLPSSQIICLKIINSDSTASRKREHQVDADEESYISTRPSAEGTARIASLNE